MAKPYYTLLPKEARIQLLAEANLETLRELCQDRLFNELCHGKRLWELRLENEFGPGYKNIDNPKDIYLTLLKDKMNYNLYPIEKKLELANQFLTKDPEKDEETFKYIQDLEEQAGEYQNILNEIYRLLSDDTWTIVLPENVSKTEIKNDFLPFRGQVKNISIKRNDKEFLTIVFPDLQSKEEAFNSLKDKYLFI